MENFSYVFKSSGGVKISGELVDSLLELERDNILFVHGYLEGHAEIEFLVPVSGSKYKQLQIKLNSLGYEIEPIKFYTQTNNGFEYREEQVVYTAMSNFSYQDYDYIKRLKIDGFI